MTTLRTKFVLVVALQVMVILAVILSKTLTLAGGVDVLLKVEPVDPRSPLRGDYLTFQYSISNLDSYLAKGQEIRNGEAVYVVLRRSGKYWVAQSLEKAKPAEGVFIKGRVLSGGVKNRAESFPGQPLDGSRFNIVYGIEEYFIPEGKGRGFVFWDKEVAARVRVGENGTAVLKQVFVDGEPWP